MDNNLFKPGVVMDLVSNSQVKSDTETIEAAVKTQQTSNVKYLGKTKTIVREFTKISRNDDCPCGSGKKYKKCCLSSGRFEKNHELTSVEEADVKYGAAQLSSYTKNPYVTENIETEEE